MPSSSHAATLERFDGSEGPRKLGPQDRRVRRSSGAGRALPRGRRRRAAAARSSSTQSRRGRSSPPLRKHSREDEYSFVLRADGRAARRRRGLRGRRDFVFKPREQWRTFWNAGDGPCRILEIISPGGLSTSSTGSARRWPDPRSTGAVDGDQQRYGMEADPDSIGRLCAAHGAYPR